MLADPDGTAVAAYGVRGIAGYAKRVSFLVDGEGRIARVYRKVAPLGHAEEVLKDLDALVSA